MRLTLRLSLLTAFLVGAFFLIGCEDQIPKPNDLDKVEGAPEVPRNLKTSVGDGTVTITWEVSDPSKIERYMIYRALETSQEFDLHDSTTSLSYTDAGLNNSSLYAYQVAAVGDNGLEGKKSSSVTATPNIYSVVINEDSRFTNSARVSVSFAAPVATQYVTLSNEPNFLSSQWVNFSGARQWELTSGDGVKRVYARFRDASGAVVSGSFSDEITLDTRAEITSLTENSNGATLEVGDQVRFTMNCGEVDGTAEIEIAGVTSIPMYDVLNGGATADGIYEAIFTVPEGIDVNKASITGSFTDAAGNNAPQYRGQSTITIANPPAAVQVTAFTISEDVIELNWTRSNASDFQSYQIFRSNTSSVTTSSELVRTETSSSASTYRDSELDPGTQYYYAVYTVDASGLRTRSNIVNATTKANENPAAVSLFITNDDSTSVTLGWTRNDDTDFQEYRVYRSSTTPVPTASTANLIHISTSRESLSFTDTNIDAGQRFYYVVVVFDRFGAKSSNSNEVRGPVL